MTASNSHFEGVPLASAGDQIGGSWGSDQICSVRKKLGQSSGGGGQWHCQGAGCQGRGGKSGRHTAWRGFPSSASTGFRLDAGPSLDVLVSQGDRVSHCVLVIYLFLVCTPREEDAVPTLQREGQGLARSSKVLQPII